MPAWLVRYAQPRCSGSALLAKEDRRDFEWHLKEWGTCIRERRLSRAWVWGTIFHGAEALDRV